MTINAPAAPAGPASPPPTPFDDHLARVYAAPLPPDPGDGLDLITSLFDLAAGHDALAALPPADYPVAVAEYHAAKHGWTLAAADWLATFFPIEAIQLALDILQAAPAGREVARG